MCQPRFSFLPYNNALHYRLPGGDCPKFQLTVIPFPVNLSAAASKAGNQEGAVPSTLIGKLKFITPGLATALTWAEHRFSVLMDPLPLCVELTGGVGVEGVEAFVVAWLRQFCAILNLGIRTLLRILEQYHRQAPLYVNRMLSNLQRPPRIRRSSQLRTSGSERRCPLVLHCVFQGEGWKPLWEDFFLEGPEGKATRSDPGNRRGNLDNATGRYWCRSGLWSERSQQPQASPCGQVWRAV